MHPNQLWMAGEQALDRKNFKRAEISYRQALAIDPRHAPALVGLSSALTGLNRHRDAHDAAMEAFRFRPPIAPVLFGIAQRLRYFHEFEALEQCLATPSFGLEAPADIIAKAAVMLSSIGAHDPAVALVERGLVKKPTDAACLHVRGNFHYFRGELDRAEACYEASLRSDPLLFQNSMMLAGVRPATEERNYVERFREQLKLARPGGNGEIYLPFALHKQLHELKRYDEAWDALARGCAAKRKQMPYQLSSDRALVDAIVETCTAQFVGETSSVEQPIVPIFIVGMHRSGTTLLERMLSGHSRVGDAGETSAFHAELELAVDRATPAGPDATFIHAAKDADFDAVARGYARRAQWLGRGKPYFTEKLPQNFLNVGLIAKTMPQARFLHLVRDPMDTCFSNLRQLFSGAAQYSYASDELAGFYLLYRRTMAHWRRVLPGRVLDISYDKLIADPEAMARRVASHCGLVFEDGMVDIQRSSGTVATPSAGTARQGFRKDRGQVWRNYERHLGPLRASLQPAYDEILPV
ncbi:sulfotransferase family protein [Lysobacter sp. TY2-98]|uniref:tetratricopeptide repeat-containing sulfotransferase family protein n=1 Tax=Lysobacter sp. TY2-98 TaxID=2290922 RepID=UPI000E206F13|nr:sulfotransferase [Lysobacter sp. TY2-98]AXK71348.1 sulfotransferase family protein [Lysobacter sp. TY2-98]